MKKVLKAFLLPLFAISLFSFSACSKKEEKVELTYGEVVHQKYHEISYAILNRMIDNKESFLLVVNPQNCACFFDFINASESYITNNHLVLYKMNIADFNGNPNHGIKIIDGSTSFTIFNKGEVAQTIASNAKPQNEIMSKKDKFEEYISQYISMPKMYLCNIATLDRLYHQSSKSLIYFSRNNCGDCSYLNKNFLIDYMRERSEILYVVECEELGIREYQANGYDLTPESQVLWDNFKVKYGLASTNNPVYGFNTGYVPTFLLVSGTTESTTYHSGAVAFNDKVELVDGQYKLTSTYYSNARQPNLAYASSFAPLEGRVVGESEIKYGSWNKDQSSVEYTPRVKAFLDSYLPQNTKSF